MKYLLLLLVSAAVGIASPARVVTASRSAREYANSSSSPDVRKAFAVEEHFTFLSEELIEAFWKNAREKSEKNSAAMLSQLDRLKEQVEVMLSRALTAGANLKPARLTELKKDLSAAIDDLKKSINDGAYP